MRELVDTTEMYLRTIFELEEEGILPLRARIAERLEQSGPTVSQTVARMERDGLLHVKEDRSLALTTEGRSLATAVMRKHRLTERLLTDIIGLEFDKVHDEACRWEHVMSEEVERKLFDVLGRPGTSPFGNPIPGLDKLGLTPAAMEGNGTVSLADLDTASEHTVSVRLIHELLQSDPLVMNELHDAKVCAGNTITVRFAHDDAILTTDAGEVRLPKRLWHAVDVSKEK
ncbi:metal-dependent transcriptional regulator [Corynebacterium ulceribovis]|uniref:metal-dependent transcriptional regulator n=1 Tax=Corynebacterium ulceribovis TaxID=487732 RepID=UPI0003A728E6|nr:metal-dependent transcriptional regulator [Corynebacterium ulceribovis]